MSCASWMTGGAISELLDAARVVGVVAGVEAAAVGPAAVGPAAVGPAVVAAGGSVVGVSEPSTVWPLNVAAVAAEAPVVGAGVGVSAPVGGATAESTRVEPDAAPAGTGVAAVDAASAAA